ncbi:hypothetical protein BFP70_13880 [Thioclava sp. SK-1]|uniref:FAD:protein FMN transferase n=1 Tax=Thioclava sp. SK-1 TaxID=1889770 RepID=UPI0008249F7B|nr:FAD:protein FMN transferase [Thioclava sp. SK-1]OCX62264.1 hypothetical protein BFP70_13880 [Thioclava sp. SK-1]
MKRRRFLQVAAAASFVGHRAQAYEWSGRAFGAEVSLSVDGGRASEQIMGRLRTELSEIEQCFSLYRPSELTRLNAHGVGPGSDRLREVLALCLEVYWATDGRFDPTVQPVWMSLSRGRPGIKARQSVGFQHVVMMHDIRLQPGQALTLNGVVQGYATDQVRALLEHEGLAQVLVNMGEYAAIGGSYRLGIEDPMAGRVAAVSLRGGEAVASSSPSAMVLAGGSHIIGPHGEAPRWSTVTVRAKSAALADAASTGFVLMTRPQIAKAARLLDISEVTLVDFDGNYGPL